MVLIQERGRLWESDFFAYGLESPEIDPFRIYGECLFDCDWLKFRVVSEAVTFEMFFEMKAH